MTGKPKILIIEDEMPVAMLMVTLLARAGCETEVAPTGKIAMPLAQDGNFDLITLDIDMPGMDGFEIYRRLKEDARLCHTPIIFVSGRPHEKDQQRARELGAADYISKPFEATDFIFRVISQVKRTGNVLEVAH